MSDLLHMALFHEDLYRIKSRPAIILEKAWDDFSAGEKEQLAKIIEALRQRLDPSLGIETFQLIHRASLALVPWQTCDRAIIFIPAREAPLYELTDVHGCQSVYSEPLQQLQLNDQLRQRLWKALQSLFRKVDK